MTKKFDKLYEEVMIEYQLNGGIKDFWQNLFKNQLYHNISKDILFFIGNNSDNKNQIQLKLNNMYQSFKTNTKFRKTVIKIFETGYKQQIKDKIILSILFMLKTNKRQRYKYHLEIKDEKANEYIQTALKQLLSTKNENIVDNV